MADPTTEPSSWYVALASIVGTLVASFGGYRMLRTQNSNANVSEASNDANIEAINTYKSLVAELRADKAAADERADKLQTELNTAIRELAAATAKVDVMTTQIMSLNEEIKLCRAEIRQLRGLPA